MPFDRSAIAELTANVNEPDALHKGVTIDDIGTDNYLTEYLRFKLDPEGTKFGRDIADLRRAVLETARSSRGGPIWTWWFGVPKRQPIDTADHRFLNLVERLYLSSPGNYGEPAVYGRSLPSAVERQQQIGIRAALPIGVLVVTGAAVVFSRRRSAISNVTRKQDEVASPSTPSLSQSAGTRVSGEHAATNKVNSGKSSAPFVGLATFAGVFGLTFYLVTHVQGRVRMPAIAWVIYGVGGPALLAAAVGAVAGFFAWLFWPGKR